MVDVSGDGVRIPSLLSALAVDEKMAMFRMAMKSSYKHGLRSLVII